MGTKLCPKIILEGTRLTHKTDIALALNDHPRIVGPRKYRYHSPLISAESRIYFRDCYDHTVQLMDMVETLRELTSGLLDVYLSSIANRTNDIMKVLTVIASIFIPLTFIVGVYGMNFEFMPELHSRWAYPAVWGIMIAIAGGLLIWFKRRRWL